MENLDVPTRKKVWNEVKKSSVPKRKHFLERKKEAKEQILATSVPKKEKGRPLKKKASVPKRNNTNFCNRKEKTLKITTYFCTV